ncbi:MAG: hypothetical protein IAE87_18370 [Rhodobacteraceae bacterium]|jgi:hypothetical protein|nr:hypothetical protein [Paracoccaceae bacterium]
MTRPLLARILAALLAALPLPATAETDPAFAAIYDGVLQADAEGAVAACTGVQAAIAGGDAPARLAAFTGLATAWGRVQTAYVLGGYDMDATDYPLLIDYFHSGKEDIPKSIERIIAGTGTPDTALYKNSYRTMTALDAAMFAGDWTPRRAEISTAIAQTVCTRLALLRDGYATHREDFLADPDKALGLTVNALIENLYKTREWRIAMVAGLTRETVGQYLPQNQQYPFSQASWAVVGAILDTYARLLDDDSQPNLATLAHNRQAEDGLAEIQAALAETRAAYAATPPEAAFALKETVPIFAGLQDMQKAFYDHLVLALGISAVLIDADGD